MSERHPARQQITSYVVNSVTGIVLTYALLLLVTGTALAAALDIGTTPLVYGLVANLVIAVVLVQDSYWEGTETESETAHVFGWLGDIVTAVFVVCWLNVLVFVAVGLGIAAPGAWGYAVATGYVTYDLLSAERGIPLSVTGVAGVLLWLGSRLTEFVEDVTWRELAPTAIINRQFGRRPPELR